MGGVTRGMGRDASRVGGSLWRRNSTSRQRAEHGQQYGLSPMVRNAGAGQFKSGFYSRADAGQLVSYRLLLRRDRIAGAKGLVDGRWAEDGLVAGRDARTDARQSQARDRRREGMCFRPERAAGNRRIANREKDDHEHEAVGVWPVLVTSTVVPEVESRPAGESRPLVPERARAERAPDAPCLLLSAVDHVAVHPPKPTRGKVGPLSCRRDGTGLFYPTPASRSPRST